MGQSILQAAGEVVLVVAVAVGIEAVLVRAGIPLMRSPFSRDRRVLMKRFLVGLADVLLSLALATLIIVKDFDRALILLLLLPLLKGLALLVLCALQSGAILLSEEQKAPVDAGSRPPE
jgi:hypothetical protein